MINQRPLQPVAVHLVSLESLGDVLNVLNALNVLNVWVAAWSLRDISSWYFGPRCYAYTLLVQSSSILVLVSCSVLSTTTGIVYSKQ